MADVLRNRPPYGETASGSDKTIYGGQPWIIFTNLGTSDATIDFIDEQTGNTTFTATLAAGLSVNFGNRVDGNAWSKFVIHPGTTTVQALFEKQNLA